MPDDLRARIAEALNTCPAQFIQDDPDEGDWLKDRPIRRHNQHCYDGSCAMCRGEADTLVDAVLTVVQPELDRRDRYEAQLRGMRASYRDAWRSVARERDRYRAAWQSARQRAEAYGEGILRHVADRDLWKSWAIRQEGRAVKAEAALAEYEHVRACVTAGEPLGRALTVSEVMEQHDVTRKALIHELGEGLHLNWRQVITATGRMRRAAFDWREDFEQARAQRDAAEATIARVRDYCRLIADGSCRVAVRETAQDVMALFDGKTVAEVILGRSSVGSPDVKAVAALTPPEDVAEILRRVREAPDAPGITACHSTRHCANWSFCHRCAPELAAEASRLFRDTDGSSEAYEAIVQQLTAQPTPKES